MLTFLIYAKKYGKYVVIVIGAIFVLLYFLFLKRKNPSAITNTEIVDKISSGLTEVKKQLKEVADKAIVETIIAKTKHEELKQQLKTTAKIKDKETRRNELAKLAKRDDVKYE
jgi:hypothetical protein